MFDNATIVRTPRRHDAIVPYQDALTAMSHPVAHANGATPSPEGALVRSGQLVDLRRHTEANRDPFIRWYADPEIARLLRHDLEPLSRREATSYFSSLILPLSRRGQCWAIHRRDTSQLIGTAAVTDINAVRETCLYRVVIGEKDAWGHGFGTETTRLVAAEVFATLPVTRFRLEVFAHNERARRAYDRVGFRAYDRYDERVPGKNVTLDIIAMELTPELLASNMPEHGTGPAFPATPGR